MTAKKKTHLGVAQSVRHRVIRELLEKHGLKAEYDELYEKYFAEALAQLNLGKAGPAGAGADAPQTGRLEPAQDAPNASQTA